MNNENEYKRKLIEFDSWQRTADLAIISLGGIYDTIRGETGRVYAWFIPTMLSTINLLRGISNSIIDIRHRINGKHELVDNCEFKVTHITPDCEPVIEQLSTECHRYFFSQMINCAEQVFVQLIKKDMGTPRLDSSMSKLVEGCTCSEKNKLLAKCMKKPTFNDYIDEVLKINIPKNYKKYWRDFLHAMRIIRNKSSHNGDDILTVQEREILESTSNKAIFGKSLEIKDGKIQMDFCLYGRCLNKMIELVEKNSWK